MSVGPVLIAQVGEKNTLYLKFLFIDRVIPILAYQLNSFYVYILNCAFEEVTTYSSVFILFSLSWPPL
jgi:hypothetical protein